MLKSYCSGGIILRGSRSIWPVASTEACYVVFTLELTSNTALDLVWVRGGATRLCTQDALKATSARIQKATDMGTTICSVSASD